MGAYPIGIVGESFDNEDGSSRQREIARCQPGEPVNLERDPENKYDSNCVKVSSARGIQIGNISRDDDWICERIDRGGFVDARIMSVGKGKRGMGVVLCIRTNENDEWLEHDLDGGIGPTTQNPSTTELAKGCASLVLICLIVWMVVQMAG